MCSDLFGYLDITDVIYDSRQSAVSRLLSFGLGTNVRPVFEVLRELTKQKLQIYANRLAIPEDDVANASVTAAVLQLLSDIERTEIAPRRFTVAFQELAKQQTFFSKTLTYLRDQNPRLSQIDERLQQLVVWNYKKAII